MTPNFYNPFSKYLKEFLSEINFNPGSENFELVFVSRIHSTRLYETWEVLKQMPHGKKPLIAHIFKYTLGSEFPLKPEDLNTFCDKITIYNEKMNKEMLNIRALPCFNSKVYNHKIKSGVVSYLLFEKPAAGYGLPEICTPNCSKDRICRYMIKDFTKGWIESVIFSENSKDPLDVNFLLTQKALYFGKLPLVTKNLDLKNAPTLPPKVDSKEKKEEDSKEPDPHKYFITIPFPKFSSSEGIKNGGDLKDEGKKVFEIKNKQQMVHVGKFLINMYKGLDDSTNLPPPSLEDSFNPVGLTFLNLTDVYLNLNTDKEGNFTNFHSDEYFGVKSQYISGVQAFVDKTLTSQKAFKELDDLLQGSFYEFIFKAVDFDVKSQKQFQDFKAMLDHPFLKNKPDFHKLKSDTGYDHRRRR